MVRVHASSVNPVDAAIAAGMLKQMRVEYEFPVISARDYAGVVEEVGSEVSGYAIGDEVFGFLLHANPAVHDGSWAETDRRLGGRLNRQGTRAAWTVLRQAPPRSQGSRR